MSSGDYRADAASPPAILSQVLRLTQRMHAQASAGDWDGVEMLQAQRHELLPGCFPVHSELLEHELVVSHLKEILRLDEETKSMVAVARNETGRMWREIHQGRQASSVYHRVEMIG